MVLPDRGIRGKRSVQAHLIPMTIQEYISENLPRTIRLNREDQGKLIGLPYPYSVPCAGNHFQEMYYWDTYFTNLGLIQCGQAEQARNNIDNMIWLIGRYGFMLNGNRTSYLYNSQPPFLALMVKELFSVAGDIAWLAKAYDALKTEAAFWENRRMTPIGLNRYCGEKMPPEREIAYAAAMEKRMGSDLGLTPEKLAYGLLAAGESGWDCTPRMTWESFNYAALDLNCLLYAQEDCLAEFAGILQLHEERDHWIARKEKRAELCRAYLKAEDGVFYDYHLQKKDLNKLYSVACFYPLFCGLAIRQEAEAAHGLLAQLETEHGILTCEQCEVPGSYQWGYPNGWAPLQYIVVKGLLDYGYDTDAKRIAQKFVRTVERCFAQTGHLWEKYNMLDGSVNVQNEYDMPPMLGWTFGVYETFLKLLAK